MKMVMISKMIIKKIVVTNMKMMHNNGNQDQNIITGMTERSERTSG